MDLPNLNLESQWTFQIGLGKSCHKSNMHHHAFHRVRCAMTKNDIVSLLKSSSPLDYPILTPLVSFISLYALLEADLILSLGTLTLTDIDHVSIMKSSV